MDFTWVECLDLLTVKSLHIRTSADSELGGGMWSPCSTVPHRAAIKICFHLTRGNQVHRCLRDAVGCLKVTLILIKYQAGRQLLSQLTDFCCPGS